MFELQKNIVFAKLKLINKLNSLSNIDSLCKPNRDIKSLVQKGLLL